MERFARFQEVSKFHALRAFQKVSDATLVLESIEKVSEGFRRFAVSESIEKVSEGFRRFAVSESIEKVSGGFRRFAVSGG